MRGREYVASVWLTSRCSISGCKGLTAAMAGLPFDPYTQQLLDGGMAEIGMVEQGGNLPFDGSPQLRWDSVCEFGTLGIFLRASQVYLYDTPGAQYIEVPVVQFSAAPEEQPAGAVAHIGCQYHSRDQVVGGDL